MKRLPSHHLAFLILVAVVVACATAQHFPVEDRTRVFDARYQNVFLATVQVLTGDGFAVTEASSGTGVINTGYKQHGALDAILIGQQRSKINVLVSETDAGCKVVLNLAMEQASGFGFSSRSMTEDQAREYYKDLFDKIAFRL